MRRARRVILLALCLTMGYVLLAGNSGCGTPVAPATVDGSWLYGSCGGYDYIVLAPANASGTRNVYGVIGNRNQLGTVGLRVEARTNANAVSGAFQGTGSSNITLTWGNRTHEGPGAKGNYRTADQIWVGPVGTYGPILCKAWQR